MKQRTAEVKTRRVNETQVLRAERAKLLQEVRRLEWRFDRQSTDQLTSDLRELRDRISDLEVQITEGQKEADIQDLLIRLEATRLMEGLASE